jgi:hypothetical protein
MDLDWENVHLGIFLNVKSTRLEGRATKTLRRIFVVVLSQFKSYILIKSHKWHAPIHKKKNKNVTHHSWHRSSKTRARKRFWFKSSERERDMPRVTLRVAFESRCRLGLLKENERNNKWEWDYVLSARIPKIVMIIPFDLSDRKYLDILLIWEREFFFFFSHHCYSSSCQPCTGPWLRLRIF